MSLLVPGNLGDVLTTQFHYRGRGTPARWILRPVTVRRFPSVIIRFLASKSISLMLFGRSELKRLALILALFCAGLLVGCGGSAPSNQQMLSGVKFRAFVSNPLQPVATGGGTPVINIVDAAKDVLSFARISLAATNVQFPGMMQLSPNRQLTVVYDPDSNNLVTISNPSEAQLTGAGGNTLSSVALPGFSESMFVWIDSATAFAAIPSAAVLAGAPGLVDRINLATATVSAQIPVPAAHFIVQSHSGNTILALSDTTGAVTAIFPSLIGTNQSGSAIVPVECGSGVTDCFDHPVWAVFSSDDNTAYIFECGPQCNGTAAAVTVLDMTASPPTIGTRIAVDGATYGMLSGTTLYVAGTPESGSNSCAGTSTSASSCGRLDLVDTATLAVTSSAVITDGYHNRMELGANGQLFVGAHNCTNINISGGEVRGCLSIFNTANSRVVVPPEIGDVTGIAPIATRNVVYVCQGGALRIFDTTTDTLQANQVNIIGQATDVKLIDAAP